MVHVERLLTEYDIDVRWRAFPLHPEIPEDGLTVEELFAGRAIDVAAIQERLKQVADSLSLPLAPRLKTYNTRPAQELAKWAESEGKGGEFHGAVFRAYFSEGRNIGKIEELLTVAASVGLPTDDIRSVILTKRFASAVDGDWDASRRMGVRAVPTFMSEGRKIVGFQPYDALARLAVDCGAKERGK
jgi:predicted DsbA family dithiol-disulfide isomerase